MKTCTKRPFRSVRFTLTCYRRESDDIEQPFDFPDSAEPLDEPDDPSDLDEFDNDREDDDERWDVFLADDDERDPEPDPGDFDGSWEPGAWSEEPE
jgi:hypothetical protein